jgi:hypothetical protein
MKAHSIWFYEREQQIQIRVSFSNLNHARFDIKVRQYSSLGLAGASGDFNSWTIRRLAQPPSLG